MWSNAAALILLALTRVEKPASQNVRFAGLKQSFGRTRQPEPNGPDKMYQTLEFQSRQLKFWVSNYLLSKLLRCLGVGSQSGKPFGQIRQLQSYSP